MISSFDILHGKILIVDDLQRDVRLLEQMLRTAGYESVTSTMDPSTVCALHLAHRYDLILLDLQMPVMDGFQVMEGLKEIEIGSYLPVLVITAQPDHKLRALHAGAKDFISKPFNLAEVLIRVRNMMEVRLLYNKVYEHGLMQESLARTDSLTGLANRRFLGEKISMAIAHAHREKCLMAVMCLDLDDFKQTNDQFGHWAGDILLKKMSDRLLATVREVDMVARLGGDEFVIVFWQVEDIEHAALAAQRMINAVSRTYDIEGNSISITASAGVSIYPMHGEDMDTLIKGADQALYEAKQAGKNAHRILGQEDQSAASTPLLKNLEK